MVVDLDVEFVLRNHGYLLQYESLANVGSAFRAKRAGRQSRVVFELRAWTLELAHSPRCENGFVNAYLTGES